ncbi:peptidase A4 family-domain-containing protein [Penicillium sp. IBT 18751x]|nr:peptidase A4 family-domain-containing protein [Penicillium sp. IBT 18751x]
MKISAASILLLMGSAIASPLAARVARRTGVSRPNMRMDSKANQSNDAEQSSNWAGAVLVSSGFTEVSGTFIVPSPQIPFGGDQNTQYCATAWVGIDGDTCATSILQTGVDFCIQGSEVSYDAWYEWIPADSVDFSGISFSAGDSVSVSVVATSKTTGTATITNNSNGQSVTHKFSSRETTSSLCETNAEWIVEDFTIISLSGQQSLAPFANFGTVTFTDAVAVRNGNPVGPSGANTISLVDGNGEVLASTSVKGSTITVTYQ